ncbi:MAG TPA: hypothetical protein VN688_28860 [Gemmataceae bacterium]|nr:hypothetical protein [Gemmataceae bacterium]
MDKPIVPPTPTRGLASYTWWLVLCLVGLDYFSTLAYLPSMAVDRATRDFAPLTALLVVLVTLFVALPIYLYVVGRSPNGYGVTGLLESHFRGWSGKLLILFLLGFIAADFVITRTLSTADASLHLIHNSYWQAHADWMTQARESLRASLPARLQGETANQVLDWWNEQLTVTVILSVLGFVLYFFLLRGFTRGFMIAAGVIVSLFVALNGVVIVSSILYLIHHPDYIANWEFFQEVAHDQDTIALTFYLAYSAFRYFPPLALGLGGFELSMASVGLVRGWSGDDPAQPRGRIRNARKLLIAAAFLMSLFLFGSVLSVTLLVPTKDLKGDGPAHNRALAYLAHGGSLQPPGHDPNAPRGPRPEDFDELEEMPAGPAEPAKDIESTEKPAAAGPTAADLNPLFGPAFGTLYDVSALLILFLAGASVTISLRDLLPYYLTRYGMEMHWARRTGLLLHLFNLIILVVILYFHASVSHQQGAYSTSVLVLLASAALAAIVDLRARRRRSFWLPLVTAPLFLACAFFLLMIVLPLPFATPSWLRFNDNLLNLFTAVIFSRDEAGLVWESPAGAVIALLFVAVIFVLAGVSRWWRSTELRYQGFTFDDDHSGTRWEEIRQLEFQVLVPHRPDHRSLAEKDADIRARHRLASDVPIIFIEAELGDPSDFHNEPLMRIVQDGGMEVIRVSHCASIAHVVAAIALEFATVGRPPEIHFAWSEESPLASNLHFLLWGEGNIPWMVHALIRKTEAEAARRPRVVIG